MKEKLLTLLTSNNLLECDDKIEFDAPLKNLGMDSLEIVSFIALIESEFNFEFEIEDLDLENFRSLNTIVDFLRKKGIG